MALARAEKEPTYAMASLYFGTRGKGCLQLPNIFLSLTDTEHGYYGYSLIGE